MRIDATQGPFKLSGLIVITLVVGAVMGLLSRFFVAARSNARRLQCASNEREVGLGLLGHLDYHNVFPNAGTFEDDPAVHGGVPTKSIIYQSIVNPATNPALSNTWLFGWPARVSCYFDYSDLYSSWNFEDSYLGTRPASAGGPTNASLATIDLGILRCPEDTTVQPKQGNLSYVVNGGFSRWHAIPVGWKGGRVDGEPGNGEILQWVPEAHSWEENQAVCKKLGVMFLGTRTGDQPWDIKNGVNDISDGTATTILLGENTLAGYSRGTIHSGGVPTNWACPLPNFCLFIASDDVCKTTRSPSNCLAGQLRPKSPTESGPGWHRATEPGSYEQINYGQNLSVEGSFPFANSGHPGGANFLFCDGSVRFLSGTIDGTIYAKLITPAGEKLPEVIRQIRLTPEEKADID